MLAVVARAAQNYQEYMQQNFASEMTSQEKGKRFIALFQEVLEKDPGLFRVIYDLTGLALWSEPLRDSLREVFAAFSDQIIREVFDNQMLEQVRPGVHAKTLANLLFGGLFGIAIQSLLEQEKAEIKDTLTALNVIFQN